MRAELVDRRRGSCLGKKRCGIRMCGGGSGAVVGASWSKRVVTGRVAGDVRKQDLMGCEGGKNKGGRRGAYTQHIMRIQRCCDVENCVAGFVVLSDAAPGLHFAMRDAGAGAEQELHDVAQAKVDGEVQGGTALFILEI